MKKQSTVTTDQSGSINQTQAKEREREKGEGKGRERKGKGKKEAAELFLTGEPLTGNKVPFICPKLIVPMIFFEKQRWCILMYHSSLFLSHTVARCVFFVTRFFFLSLMIFCNSSYAIKTSTNESSCPSCNLQITEDESCLCIKKQYLKRIFFYSILHQFSVWHGENSEKTAGIIGSLGICHYKNDTVLRDLDEIHILAARPEINKLFFYLNGHIQSLVYTQLTRLPGTANMQEPITCDVHLIAPSPKESQDRESLQSGQVTLRYLEQKLASLKVSVIPDSTEYDSLRFTPQPFYFPDDIRIYGKSNTVIPILEKTCFILLDKLVLDEEIKKITTAADTPPHQSLLKTVINSCQTLATIRERLAFYSSLLRIQNDESMTTPRKADHADDIVHQYNQLVTALQERPHLADLIYDDAFAISYKLIPLQAQSEYMWSSRLVINAEQKKPDFSFNQLNVLLNKDIALYEVSSDGNCFYQAIANNLNSTCTTRSAFLNAEERIKTQKEAIPQAGISDKCITAQTLRAFIHSWIDKATSGLTQENKNHKDMLSDMIGRTDTSIKNILKNCRIKNLAPTPDSSDFYGWVNLIFPVTLATAIPIVVLTPNIKTQEITSVLFSTKKAVKMWPDLIHYLKDKTDLIATQQESISDTLFIVYSGPDHVFWCSRKQSLSRRLKTMALYVEQILYGKAWVPSEFPCQVTTSERNESAIQPSTHLINGIFSASPSGDNTAKKEALLQDHYASVAVCAADKAHHTDAPGGEKTINQPSIEQSPHDNVDEIIKKKKKKKKKKTNRPPEENLLSETMEEQASMPREKVVDPQANLEQAMATLSLTSLPSYQDHDKKRNEPSCSQSVVASGTEASLLANPLSNSQMHSGNLTDMEKQKLTAKTIELTGKSNKNPLPEHSEEQHPLSEKPCPTDPVHIEKTLHGGKPGKKKKKRRNTADHCKKSAITKPADLTLMSHLSAYIEKITRLMSQAGCLQPEVKKNIRNDLMEKLFTLIKTSEEKSISDTDKLNIAAGGGHSHESNHESNAPRIIVIKLTKCNELITRGLALADQLDDPSAPLISGMMLMNQLKDTADNATIKAPLEVIHLFDKAARRGNIEGSLLLYWLALHTGSPEALSCSLLSTRHINPTPSIPLIKFLLSEENPLQKTKDYINMPLVIKNMVSAYKRSFSDDPQQAEPDLYCDGIAILDQRYPKSTDLQKKLTPEQLFKNKIDFTHSNALDNTLINMAHMGYYYLETGQSIQAIDQFLPAAVAYTILLKNQDKDKITNIAKAAGLASTYHCMVFFHSCRPNDIALIDNDEEQDRDEGDENVSAMPKLLMPWIDNLEIVANGLRFCSTDHYIYSLIEKYTEESFFRVETKMKYILLCQNSNHQVKNIDELEKELRDRANYLTYQASILPQQACIEMTTEKREPSKKPLKKQTRITEPERKRITLKKRESIQQDSVITTEISELFHLRQKIQFNEKEKATQNKDHLDKVAAIFKKLAKKSEEISNKQDISDCIFNTGSVCLEILSNHINPLKKLTHDDAKAIFLFKKNFRTKTRAEKVHTGKSKKTIEWFTSNFHRFLLKLLNPENYEEVDKNLLHDLISSLSLCHDSYKSFHRPSDDDVIASIVNLLSETVHHFDSQDDLCFILETCFFFINKDTPTKKEITTLSTALIKALIAITSLLEFEDWKTHFDCISNIMNKYSTSNYQNYLKGVWDRITSSYTAEFENIMNKNQAIWEKLILKEEKEQEEKERSRPKKQKAKTEKKRPFALQMADTHEYSPDELYEIDLCDSNKESHEKAHVLKSNNIDYSIEMTQHISMENKDAFFNYVYTLSKEESFNRAIHELESAKDKINGDSLISAEIELTISEYRLHQFEKETMKLKKIKAKRLLALSYGKQYKTAEEQTRFPGKISKEDLNQLYLETLPLSNRLDKEDHLLVLAINNMKNAKEIMELFLIDRTIEEKKDFLCIKSQYELLKIQIDKIKLIINSIVEIYTAIEGAIHSRKKILKKINEQKERTKKLYRVFQNSSLSSSGDSLASSTSGIKADSKQKQSDLCLTPKEIINHMRDRICIAKGIMGKMPDLDSLKPLLNYEDKESPSL